MILVKNVRLFLHIFGVASIIGALAISLLVFGSVIYFGGAVLFFEPNPVVLFAEFALMVYAVGFFGFLFKRFYFGKK